MSPLACMSTARCCVLIHIRSKCLKAMIGNPLKLSRKDGCC